MINKQFTIEITPAQTGLRLDQALAELLPEFSRARLSQWIKEGKVLVDGRMYRPRDKVVGGEQVIGQAVVEADERHQAEDIRLDVVHEDEALLVINKPAGMVVHPAAGNPSGTLLNALLHHVPSLVRVPRAGIVHRIDKETSGLLVVAKTLEAQTALVYALQRHEIKREYDTVVVGALTGGGIVDAPLGRHAVDRKRQAVMDSGRPAVTHYRLAERFRAHTRLTVRLETGRTHQIRVHMAHLRHPIVGDPVYGGRLRLPPACNEQLRTCLQSFRRQALHAACLGLQHPNSGDYLEWAVEAPEDMQQLLSMLREDARHADPAA